MRRRLPIVAFLLCCNKFVKCFSDEIGYSSDDDYEMKLGGHDSSPDSREEKQYEAEIKAGSISDLFGTNQHYTYPEHYKDFGRRFVPQYPYKDKLILEKEAEEKLHNAVKKHEKKNEIVNNHLIPVKASPEFVLAVAKQSALLEAAKPPNPTEDIIDKDTLRTGDYWNAVWREDIDPKKLLRSSGKYRQHHGEQIKTLNVKIKPGSQLYQLVAALKKISPRLLYIINE